MHYTQHIRHLVLAAVMAPLVLAAQTAPGDSTRTYNNDPSPYGTPNGTQELTIGGSGSSDKHLDSSSGGVDFSYGYYFTGMLEGVIRQTASYSNPRGSGSVWDGDTRVALDWNFGQDRIRPILGANFGRIYGDSVHDTWAAGLEGGAKFYVIPHTFVQALVEYGWFFDRGHQINDRFNDGRWNWGLAIGFNF